MCVRAVVPLFVLSLATVWPSPARARPPARLPTLPSPGALSLSLEVWRVETGRVESGAMATLSVPLERLAAPRQKIDLAPPPPPVDLARVEVPADLPTLRPVEVSRVLRAAWRAADLAIEDDRLDRLAQRARAAAALPELRLRAGRTVDRSLRISSDYDGSTQQSLGGVGSFYEVRATFRLDRAIFADEEVALARLRRERAEERRKLTREVLETMQALLRALASARDPSAPTDVHLDAEARALAASLALDGLTSGAWSEVWAAATARQATRSSPAPRAAELASRSDGPADAPSRARWSG